MIAVLLLLLLVVWAAVLVPPWLRARAQRSPSSSIAGFNRRLSLLGARAGAERPLPGFAPPLPPIPPPAFDSMIPLGLPLGLRQSEAQRRLMLILEALLIALGCSLFLGLLPGLHFFLVLFVLDLVASAGYVALLVQWKRNRAERAEKVRSLPVRRVPARPVRSVPSFATLNRQAR
jgi:hypothetical protein